MPRASNEQIRRLQVRARLPQYIRAGSIVALVCVLLAIGVGFYRARNHAEFRMKGFPTSLSKDVVAEVNGYERREADGEQVKYYIKADKAITFADNHQELQNIFLQVFDAGGSASDQITAAKAVYLPEVNKNFTAYFAGDVNITTRDALNVETEQLTYKKATEIATADEEVKFQRENVTGRAFGAVVDVPAKRIDLLRDVVIEAEGSDSTGGQKVKRATINAVHASYDQAAERVDADGGVKVWALTSTGESSFDSDRARVALIKDSAGSRDVSQVELFGNVQIASRSESSSPTAISAGYAHYDKDNDNFDLKDSVTIVISQGDKPTTIKSQAATYAQRDGRVRLEGNAEITQGGNYLRGDHIDASLFAAKKLKDVDVRGGAFLKQTVPERTSEVSAAQVTAAFDEQQQLVRAAAVSNASAVLIPSNAVDYSKVTMMAPTAIRLFFKGAGTIDRMLTEGRTTIQLDAPAGRDDAANKRVIADAVKTVFDADGKNMQRAEAAGNAELYVEPLKAAAENYKTTISAPRFDCDFFPTGNNARVCVAGIKTTTIRVPTVPAPDRGDQKLSADKLTANFDAQTRDISSLEASGSSKFTERDRNAIADQINFTDADKIVRLRGGEPTVWDSRARGKAGEIDWDTRAQRSALRGGVSTTYYSQNETGGATPFAQTDKPVYITAAAGDFDHRAETAVYTGNARGWQDNNYVRGDRFTIQQKEGQFTAEGSVQSLLYNAKRRENGRESNVPVFAQAKLLTFSRDSRLLHYQNDVDIRQGTDRIVGGEANVLLDDKGDVARTDVQNNVVITQPTRKAVGDFAQYVAADQSVVLRGNPARVQDAENGSSEGGQLTVYLNDNRVISEGRPKQSASGRTRSVYKVKNN